MIAVEELQGLAARLTKVPGVEGLLTGGSELEVTIRPTLTSTWACTPAGRSMSGCWLIWREVAGPRARVTEPGEWGPWVDGGAG